MRKRAGSKGDMRRGLNGVKSTVWAMPSTISSAIASPVAGALRTPQTLCPWRDRSVAFDRSAALIHPAVDRTGRRRGGAGAGLGAERRGGRAARRVTAGKEGRYVPADRASRI